ncbi:hypothetical protein SAMN05877809_101118 [Rhodobacter sp. JA431]|uniref:hypothetical protein n=1 Tax=Rhodobacter sp. JA431 TaxID=570013 RepID=UPI000BC9208B|nr:hypothetical protein [Rhodobacter sp. JA431]SOB90053.1 hypothetical protein SAMN05877809_101118 [Rhodobacter sp. JA431]
MPRRNWRDLQAASSAAPKTPGQGAATLPKLQLGSGTDLTQAAALAPDSRLGALLEQRKSLETRLQGLTGMPQTPTDTIGRRFDVASFAERRNEHNAWVQAHEARQASLRERLAEHRDRTAQFGHRAYGTDPEPIRPSSAKDRSAFPSSEIAGLRALGQTDFGRRIKDGLAERAGSGLGASGLGDIIGKARTNLGDIGSRLRSGANDLASLGSDLRRGTRDKIDDYDRQLRDLDTKLAAEGISAEERAQIRRDLGGDKLDKLDKTGGRMDRAAKALEAPKELAGGLERGWGKRKDALTAPMDAQGPYAEMRKRRLSSETGGSGDLFTRMARNRAAALERRRAAKSAEQRDEARRDRARQAKAQKKAEETGGSNRT